MIPRPLSRTLSLTAWAFLTWEVLVWTLTWEQQLVGLAVALAVGAAMAPLGDVPGPWQLLTPRRLIGLIVLVATSLYSVVRANLSLSRRIWSPQRPLSSGMVVLPAGLRSDSGVAATALISSLIVDNQCVDLDRSADQLQYHVVAMPSADAASRTDHINAPTERRLQPLLNKGQSGSGGIAERHG